MYSCPQIQWSLQYHKLYRKCQPKDIQISSVAVTDRCSATVETSSPSTYSLLQKPWRCKFIDKYGKLSKLLQ